ncbi:MAG: aminodeoxychorismate synthase component I [Gammaproteobacteria bacterium]
MTVSHKLEGIPDLLAIHALKPDTYPYLLASNTRGGTNARYSMLLSCPQQIDVQFPGDSDCLASITVDVANSRQQSDLPFCGGWFVFLSYEYAQIIEPQVDYFAHETSLPIAFKTRIPAAIVVDHDDESAYIIVEQEYSDLQAGILEDIDSPPRYGLDRLAIGTISEDEPDCYIESIRKAKQYIRDGDIFQANLSRNWTVKFKKHCDPIDLYYSLSQSNPAQFAALIKFRDQYIISSSPERLISLRDGMAQSRPIAGTHPRGKTAEEDANLSRMLLAHPKEQAEHVMLIDLVRNDLGRFCQAGSIKVTEKMVLETYEHVHHIVSNIEGQVRNGTSVRDIVHAVFPGGTITGCPKVRCMEIISELEQSPRGAYTGSLGYIGLDGQMDLNILIRTLLYDRNTVSFRAGAGIVHDSVPEKELMETRHKAKGLLNAIKLHA